MYNDWNIWLNSAEQKHKYTKLFYVCSVLSLCTTWRVGKLHGRANSCKFTITLKGSSGKQKYLQRTYSGCSLTLLLLYWLSLSPSDEGMAFPKVSLKFSVSLNCVLLDSPLTKWVTMYFFIFLWFVPLLSVERDWVKANNPPGILLGWMVERIVWH